MVDYPMTKTIEIKPYQCTSRLEVIFSLVKTYHDMYKDTNLPGSKSKIISKA